MMFGQIQLSTGEEPIYRQLADAIAERIAKGELATGDKLPPQRKIARSLGINLTTVTRAFSTLQQRGLVESRAGRGTIVAAPAGAEPSRFKSAPTDEAGFVDLSVNRPATTAYLEALAVLLPRLQKDRRYPMLQDYHPPEGPAWARSAVAEWLAPIAGGGDPSRVMLTDGAQHGLACVLAGIVRPGDVVLSDSVTYQGINALCWSRGIDLRGLPMDRDGMQPDRFDAACRQWRPRAVFLVPSLHNPTTITLSESRRRAIVDIARRHNVIMIEDDVYGALLDQRLPSFAALEPELTIHIGSFSKCVAPGLRLGFVAAPRVLMGDIAAALRIDCWSISPLTALIGTVLLEDGAAAQLIGQQQVELRLRQALVQETLTGVDLQTAETSTHVWIHVPAPQFRQDFAETCRQHGVGVLSAEAFTIGHENVPHAIRINVAAARSRQDLRRALEALAALIRSDRTDA